MTIRFNLTGAFLLALAFCLQASPLAAGDKLPETTEDGLKLKQQTDLGAVYIKPGATLAPYHRVYLVDAYVAFAKDWQRDYNRDQIGLGRRVTNEQMEKIKTRIAEDFKKVFTKELEDGGYAVVQETGDDVMIMRPAIINLQVTAPDTPTAGMGQVFVRSAGSLTLYAEMYDSVTNDKFAEVIDAEAVGDRGLAYASNRVTNEAELKRTLGKWASLLRKRLDEAHQATSG